MPMDPNFRLSKTSETSLSSDEATIYRRIIRRLLYLQITRSDICFALHYSLSQFLHQPSTAHISAVHHLLRYLKSCPGQGILLQKSTSFQLKTYVDADWGASPETRRSVTEFCIFLGESLITCKSKKQPNYFVIFILYL